MTETPRNYQPPGQPHDEPPPFLSSWNRIYIAVLLHLLFWIGIFYAFTSRFDVPR